MPSSGSDPGDWIRRALKDHDAERETRSGDFLLGHIALELGLLTEAALLDCMREKQDCGDPDIGAVLLRRGLLDAAGLERLKKEHDARSQRSALAKRYEIQERLGEGAMAVVYRAMDRELKRIVALKLLRRTGPADSSLRARFRREAETAGRLTHPNIIKIHDAGEDEDRMYIVMELIDGKHLTEHPAARSGDLRERVRLIEKAARAIEVAHRAGVVHRDLKPANILVTADGEPHVGDFGLATAGSSDVALTKTGVAIGTPLYMAPEQVRGTSSEISPRTDVYALGAILYELLSGRPPHVGATVSEVYTRILDFYPEPFHTFGLSVSEDLEAIVQKALSRSPRDRYASAGELADDLHRFIDGEEVRAKRASSAGRMLRLLSKHRSGVAIAVFLGAALGLGAWVTTERIGRARRVDDLVASAARYETAGNLNLAREAFRAALTLDVQNAAASAGASRITEALERRERDRDEALGLLEAAKGPLDEAARCLYKSSSNYDDLLTHVARAEHLARRAIEKAPNLPLAHHRLGCAYAMKGWLKEAEASWRRASDFGPARYQLGRLLLERASIARLTEFLAGGRAKESAAELAQQATGEIEAALRQGIFDDSQQLSLAQAMVAVLANRADDAESICMEAIARLKGRQGAEDFLWLRGRIQPHAERRRLFEEAIALRPHFPVARHYLADIKLQLGDFPGALVDLDEAVAFSPQFGPALVLRAFARFRTGAFDGAIADTERVLALEPREAIALVIRAGVFREKARLDVAIRDANDAIAMDDTLAAAFTERGRIRVLQRDEPGALADFGKSIELDPGLTDAYLARGQLFMARNQFDEAITEYTRAIGVLQAGGRGPLAYFHYWRAIANQRLGRQDRAADDARRALELRQLPPAYREVMLSIAQPPKE